MLDDYQDLIDELLGTPKLFRDLLAGASGEVSPEILALIADLRNRDRVVLDRLQRLTRETAPHLVTLPGPDDAVETAEATSADDLIASFDSARGDLISLLMNLTLKDWTRTATYDGPGEITLADEVERHVEYDETRVEQVRAAA
jgi:DinB superfamily